MSAERIDHGEPLTPEDLGHILDEEFERDGWGTVDPYYFGRLDQLDADHQGLDDVMHRVAERINARFAGHS